MELSFSEAKGMFSTAIDLVKKGSQLEAQAQIQELQQKYLELHAENLELKQEILSLKEKIQDQEYMVFEEPYFYSLKGDSKIGPFCPRCWQKDSKKCRVVSTPDSYSAAAKCQVCDQGFGIGRRPPNPRVVKS